MIKSTKLLIGLLKTPKAIVSKTTCMLVQQKHYQVKHYRKKSKNNCHTILIFGGFSVYGYKDVRLNNLAKSLAGANYRVLIIALPDIEKLTISTSTITDIKQIINSICEDYYFSSGGKVSILAPSFSAGLVLAACADPKLKDKVKAICCIGTFATINTTFDYILQESCTDDYARNIILKNLLPYSKFKNSTEYLNLVETAIFDNGFKRNQPELQQVLRTVTEPVANQWSNWNSDKQYRLKFVEEVFNSNERIATWKQAFNIIDIIHHISMPIVFIHGNNDDVIPKNESILLHQKRVAFKLPSFLCITNVISHGDQVRKSINAKEFINITKAFTYFFKYAK